MLSKVHMHVICKALKTFIGLTETDELLDVLSVAVASSAVNTVKGSPGNGATQLQLIQ